MLEAIPKSIFSSKFRLHQENQLLGELDTSIWREKARVELEEGTYELYRLGHFSGPIRIFLFWLVYLMWKRQQAAAS